MDAMGSRDHRPVWRPDNAIVTHPVTDTFDPTPGLHRRQPAASTVVTPTITWNNGARSTAAGPDHRRDLPRARAIAAPGTTNSANSVNSFADGTRVNQSTGSVQTPIHLLWATRSTTPTAIMQDVGEVGILGAHVQLCNGNCTGGNI
jgi:hypothetical protein